MAFFTLVHIKRHGIIPTHTREQRDAPQSRYNGSVRHAETRCGEIVHVDDDVAVLVLGRIEGEVAVFSLGEDVVEIRHDSFDDAKVKLGLGYHLGESGEDEASLGARDFEIDILVK